jgi:hypothetical protein
MNRTKEGSIVKQEFAINLNKYIFGRKAFYFNLIGKRAAGYGSTAINDICEYLDTTQELHNSPTAGQTLYAVSTSADDADAGTGVNSIKIVYLDSTGLLKEKLVTLNGVTPVSIGTGYTEILYVEAASVGSGKIAAGDIAISSTNGVATVATTFELIKTGDNRSFSGRIKVPKGYTAFLESYSFANVAGTATFDAQLVSDVSPYDGELKSGIRFQHDRDFLAALGRFERPAASYAYPELSKIILSAIPSAVAAANKCQSSCWLLLVADNPEAER